ncbi:MAG TPA: SPFH domain-containing protein [Ktedonobacteraceae bacterium]|nr:SPFH domain-containing protein [Ktedonobacteraceae bacterium]
MTPDRNEPNANPQRQSTSAYNVGWDDTPVSFDDMSKQTNVLENEDLDFTSGGNFDDESDAGDDEDTPSSTSGVSRSELFRQVGLQLSPILIPLLFGGLTFLCTLPFVLNGHAYIPFNRFWPVGLVIVALAILQGMGLYYAGSNNVYWMMGVVGGFCLFLLVGCFTVIGAVFSLFLLLILLAVSILGMRTSMRSIKEGSVAIVSASGKYSRTLLPGLNFLLPWEKIEMTVNTREVQWQCPEQQVRISREEDVLLRAAISYQLEPEDAHIAALQVEKWEDSLRNLFNAAVQTVATELTPEDFLAWSKGFRSRQPVNGPQLSGDVSRWERINALLYQRMRDKVALWGVQINWIQVHDILLVPHVASLADMANGAGGMPLQQATRQASAGQSSAPPLSGTPQPSAAANAGAAAKELKNMNPAQLIAAYNSVKKGTITDPSTIRGIAARFEVIANDPEESQKVEFDAARAARNLYARAQLFEEQMSQVDFSDDFNDVTQADFNEIKQPVWNMRRPTDDD